MNDGTDEVPSDDDPGEDDGLELGAPFAIAHDCQLLGKSADGRVPGCFASIQCHGCGTVFKIDLLSTEDDFGCPGCDLTYTSALLVSLADDVDVPEHFVAHVLRVNGFEAPATPPNQLLPRSPVLSPPEDDDGQE